jgi:hypothetical protein
MLDKLVRLIQKRMMTGIKKKRVTLMAAGPIKNNEVKDLLLFII